MKAPGTILAVLLLASCAAALLVLLVQQAAAHDWYTRKWSPTRSPSGEKRGCCGGTDCASVPARFNAERGEIEVFIGGRWWVATDPRWFVGPSPDGGWHGCQMPEDVEPRCTFGGAGA